PIILPNVLIGCFNESIGLVIVLIISGPANANDAICPIPGIAFTPTRAPTLAPALSNPLPTAFLAPFPAAILAALALSFPLSLLPAPAIKAPPAANLPVKEPPALVIVLPNLVLDNFPIFSLAKSLPLFLYLSNFSLTCLLLSIRS